MKTKILAILTFALFISSCGKPTTPVVVSTPSFVPTTTAPLPTLTPVCISSEPTQKDIDRVRSFTSKALDPTEWEQTYAVSNGRVSVTWMNSPDSAVIYLEAIIFPCGYEEPDLNHYFSDANWKSIFQNYENYKLIGECKTDKGLRLYQFKASSQGYDYNIRYWVTSDSDTRVITTMMTYPVGAESLLDGYSSRLFPDLPNCS